MALACATGVALLAAVLIASPAQAAAYRYWTYWQGTSGTWAFATIGPASAVPADGAVEGWSFRVSTDVADPDAAPRQPADFAAVCSGTPAEAGFKRVALVIDPGPPGIAPAGQAPPAAIATCVVAEEDATGYEVLRSVVEVRTEDGLVCALAGYPTGECAPVLDDAEAAALLAAASASPSPGATPSAETAASGMTSTADTTSTDGSSSPVATIAVVIALLGGAAAWGWSRRRSTR